MVRIKAAVYRKKGRKRLFKLTKGFYGQKKNRWGQAIRAAIRALRYSTKHRRARARDFRKLWIVRINAACTENGLAYSRLIRGLKEAKVVLDRKMLAEIALNDPKTFAKIVAVADKALPSNVTRMKKN
ncbi:MAG: 50S ribosomal protein L20 [Candidatus Omnitrophica bacterium]|nr:50S ribosomal protein L20 [Candidatus Omnitrophota bacterium]